MYWGLPSAVGRTIFSWVTVSLRFSVENPSNCDLRSTATFGKSSNFGADIFQWDTITVLLKWANTQKEKQISFIQRNFKCFNWKALLLFILTSCSYELYMVNIFKLHCV